MSLISNFLVDFDGTLISSSRANAMAYVDAFGFFGININYDDVLKYSGEHFLDFFAKILPKDTYLNFDPIEIHNKKIEIYPKFFSQTSLNIALVDFLLLSKPNLINIGIVSSASNITITNLLDYYNIRYIFDFIISGDMVIKRKPDPEIYNLALTKYKINPSSCIAFEDSSVGIESAHSAKLRTVKIEFFN